MFLDCLARLKSMTTAAGGRPVNKYRNIKSDGFDSQKEKRRYEDLLLMQHAGEIRDLNRQVRFVLTPRMHGKYRNERESYYVADFTYYKVNKDGQDEFVVEDVKSEYTRNLPQYKLKRKQMLYRYNISIFET